MEIQIPLVIFTSFLAWAAGIFGTQCILALQKRGGAVQLPALICSAVVLVVGGIAVVFHLTHPFNLFNGFGHITSGITQELIAIVLLAVVMVLFFLMLRRSEDDTVPQWLAVVGIVVVLVLIVAMGHSYMMPSLPAWDTVLQLLSLLGAACVMGPATVAFIGAVKGVEIEGIGLLTVIGAAVNAVLSAAYMFAMEASSATFQSFQYYFDPTHPNVAMANPANVLASLAELDDLVRPGLVITVADALAWDSQVDGVRLAQAAQADIIIANKADAVSEERLATVLADLRRHNPRAVILPAVEGNIVFARLDALYAAWLDAQGRPPSRVPQLGPMRAAPVARHMDEGITTCCRLMTGPVSETELRLLLTAVGSGLWRAKGIVDLRGDGGTRPAVVQYAAGRLEFEIAPDDAPERYLVFIGVALDPALGSVREEQCAQTEAARRPQ